MFEIFTKPSGKETTKGKTIGILAGVIVASGFYALSLTLELFSPTVSAVFPLFFIITTYEVRKRLAKIVERQEDEQE